MGQQDEKTHWAERGSEKCKKIVRKKWNWQPLSYGGDNYQSLLRIQYESVSKRYTVVTLALWVEVIYVETTEVQLTSVEETENEDEGRKNHQGEIVRKEISSDPHQI